jgi:hypothetical protein
MGSIPERSKIFVFLHNVHTGSGAYRISYPINTCDP